MFDLGSISLVASQRNADLKRATGKPNETSLEGKSLAYVACCGLMMLDMISGLWIV